MPKFSIIIPVYNVEKYIVKCIESVLDQTYQDYEIIIVNDGTKDNSIELIKNFPVKIINQENKGLSEARNTGIKNAKGEYLIFLDSDDYIEEELLQKIAESTKNKPDLVRYQAKDVTDNMQKEYNELSFEDKNGNEAIEIITKFHYVDPVWLYAVKRKYYKEKNFSFTKGIYHEDFAITPLLITLANKVNCIGYVGYNYVQRNGSIMNNSNKEKQIKKIEDTITIFKDLREKGKTLNIDSKYYYSYIANAVIYKISNLDNELYKKYKKVIKEEKIYELLMNDTFTKKIKNIILRISPKIYYKIKG